jgi:drug/metabolite transporter (DMT)-like permease
MVPLENRKASVGLHRKDMDNKKSWIIWSSFLLLTLAWGTSFILVKRSLQGGFTAFEVASIRMLSAFAVLSIPAAWSLRHIPRNKLPYVAASGLLSMLIPAYLFCTAQVHIESSVASILNALTPACTFVVGIAVFKQPMNKMQIVGLLTGFAGSVMLILINSKGEFSLNNYAMLVLAATLCYGINVNMVKNKLHDVNAIHFSTVAVAVAGLTAGLFLTGSGNFAHVYQHSAAHPKVLGAAILLGVMSTALAQVVFNYMLTLTTSVFASSITYFIPIVAVIWGVWDGEILLLWHYLGMAFIIGGILILNKFR